MFCIVQECIDDGNNFGYKAECDPDLNKYDTDDLKDLSKAGMGVAGREVILSVDFIVFLLIILFILGMIGAVILRGKGFFGGKP